MAWMSQGKVSRKRTKADKFPRGLRVMGIKIRTRGWVDKSERVMGEGAEII